MKILLAGDDAERARLRSAALQADAGLDVVRLRPGEPLADAVAEHKPDALIIDLIRPHRAALDGVRQVGSTAPCPVVLFIDEDDPAFMEEAIGAGVSSYHVSSVPPPNVRPILRAAAALFRQHRRLREELRIAEQRLGERAVIDRAKAILIRDRRLAEPAAYAWLRQTAMTRGRRIIDVAEEVVRASQSDDGEHASK